ncbi:hypothetical protein TRVL_02941 [Trypanosoma vivax]|nr:hypothetical protein TRVL_02941 [Trypanosoma vivax]
MSMRAVGWLQHNLGLDMTGEWAKQITFNVGGITYVARRSLFQPLAGHPIFGPIVSGKDVCDESGAFFIDRDGVTFRFVLNFIRHRTLLLPDGFNEWEQLLDDARYFQLPQMEELILGCFEYQRYVLRQTLPRAVFVHWPPASEAGSKVVVTPALPLLTPTESALAVRYQEGVLHSLDELVTVLLSAYGYAIQHWNQHEGKVHFSLGHS